MIFHYDNIRDKRNTLSTFCPTFRRRVIVLGNGPSLSDSIKKYKDIMRKESLMCVNYFATTELFVLLKPKYYVLADPAYFDQAVPEDVRKSIDDLADNINKKLTWNLTFFCPDYAKGSDLICKLLSNKLIRVVYYSSQGIPEGFVDMKRKMQLLSRDKIIPPSQTVLNTCVSLCIYYKFQNIILVGADTSWHTGYELDQQTNTLYMNDEHFYGAKKLIFCNNIPSENSPLAYQFVCLANALNCYKFLELYSRYRGVKIYNASEVSWIDSFERKKLDEIVNG